MHLAYSAAVVAMLLSFSPSSAVSDDRAALTGRLHQASTLTALDVAGLKPWHLHANVQLFDNAGKSTETGTIEEWWASPTLYRVVYTTPSFTGTELRNEQGLYKSTANNYPPEMLSLLRVQIVHPMPPEAEIDDAAPELRTLSFGKVPMDCIMLTQHIKGIAFEPLGLFPTYCFDRDKSSLRLTSNFGSMLLSRNKMGTFQARSVPVDESIQVSGKVVAKAQLDQLVSAPLVATDFVSEAGMVAVDEEPALVPSAVVAVTKLGGDVPKYPDRAKQNHVSGQVVFHALIGTDGHIHHLTLISSPDPDLALASFAAVRTWTYKPYLLNGKPTMVDTTIIVNFAFRPA